MKEIVITKMPILLYNYFQWLLLGLYEMQNNKEIKLNFHINFWERIIFLFDNKYVIGIVNYICRKYFRHIDNSYCMEGYLKDKGKKIFFCVDCADTPYLFDKKLLEKVSYYFKLQCPKEFDKKGFRLTDTLYLPYIDVRFIDKKLNQGERELCDTIFQYLHKIKPGMIGPRRLSRGNTYKALKKGYNNYMDSGTTTKDKNIMCYFGDALGPKASVNLSCPDYNSESNIVSVFYNDISHPNEKRAIAADILTEINDENDARIINRGNSDSIKGKGYNEDLIVPLKDFCHHIAQFKYNLNISGYRLSIPNRFIESFVAGTAVITDKLFVKWFLPFDKEVYETVEMGYLPNEKVNWEGFVNDIKHLPPIDGNEIIDLFKNKWSPVIFARYIVNTLERV